MVEMPQGEQQGPGGGVVPRVLWGRGLTGGCSLPQHCIAEKVRTIRKYRSRPLCEYGGG